MNADKTITVKINGKDVVADAGLTLSEIIKGEKPCGGHGKCGKCKVIVRGNISKPSESETELITPEELARGVRLACLTYALGDCEVETLSYAEKAQIVTDGASAEFDIAPEFSDYGVAIDIGTTTLAARLYNTAGDLLAQSARLNPQSEWGADVISRIEASLDGKSKVLADSIRNALNSIVSELAAEANVDAKSIDEVVITGNTVMLSLLVCESVEPFSHAPFRAKRLFGETLFAKDLALTSLRPDARIYLPSCISAFVGADTTCAIIATRLCETENGLLVDIGTNGEMALWNGNKLSVCSTAAGPAFEGVGISMGMRGSVGAIDKVVVSGQGLSAHVIGGGAPVGICGSGLVDAIACMLESEELDETGLLEDEPYVISAPVSLTQNDIRMVQLAKSAICAGMLTLLETEKLSVKDVSIVYVAGGFGNYLNMNNAEKVGLLPGGAAGKTQSVGNAALGGASMLLLAPKYKAECESLAKKAVSLDLSTNKLFSDHYIEGMIF